MPTPCLDSALKGRLKKKKIPPYNKNLWKKQIRFQIFKHPTQTSSPTKSPKFLEDCLKNPPLPSIYTPKTNITPEHVYLEMEIPIGNQFF